MHALAEHRHPLADLVLSGLIARHRLDDLEREILRGLLREGQGLSGQDAPRVAGLPAQAPGLELRRIAEMLRSSICSCSGRPSSLKRLGESLLLPVTGSGVRTKTRQPLSVRQMLGANSDIVRHGSGQSLSFAYG